MCTEIVSDIQNNFCTQYDLPMLICKKKSFLQRFTCTEVRNPEICSGPLVGWTPFHFAARFGHVEVCRFIMDNNPETPNGLTPLHYAARYGHFEVCKLIVENVYVYDKNPRYGNTGCGVF